MPHTLRAPHEVLIDTIRELVLVIAVNYREEQEQTLKTLVIQLEWLSKMTARTFYCDQELAYLVDSLTTIPALFPTFDRESKAKIDCYAKMGEGVILQMKINLEERLYQ